MIGKIKNIVKRNAYNAKGICVNGRIVVIESDDWGMIRTSSTNALKFLSATYPLAQCGYSMHDALERRQDVEGLLQVLESNKSNSDIKNIPRLTANFVTHNPDFKKIKKTAFTKYYRETFWETYQNYDGFQNASVLLKDAFLQKLIVPQYHATEHININNWMFDLRNSDQPTLHAFEYGMANLHKEIKSNCSKEHLDAFGYRKTEKFEPLEITLQVGLEQFEKSFGRKSETMIAPCYLWDENVEKMAFSQGVRAFQGGAVQKIPTVEGFYKKRHYMGQNGKYGQRYFIRNCQFENVDNPEKDWVDSCMRDIEIAFKWKKPAIISSHRVNYIGRLNEANRTKGLKMLDALLKAINKKWPDVQYMSTPELLKNYYS